MVIPLPHSTTTGNLLQTANAKSLLGEYPADIFFHLEARRPVPEVLSFTACSLDQIEFPPLDHNRMDRLVENFFELVNQQHPILERADFQKLNRGVWDRSPGPDVESALAFIVFALGSVAVDKPDTGVQAWLPGVEFFTPALRVLLALWPSSFGANFVFPQALYLAALYFSYLARPLQSWRLVHMASTNVQHSWIRCQTLMQDSSNHLLYQPLLRVCWAIFVLECDILAEHHLPRSGIEQIIDKLPFPLCGSPPDRDMLHWLADLSARSMLNRAHHVMYSDYPTDSVGENTNPGDLLGGGQGSLTSLAKVSAELNRQLYGWFELLPPSIKPDLDKHEPSVDEVTIILRYHAAGDIIFRPFLLHVCAFPMDKDAPDILVENALICLHHCREYLLVVSHRVEAASGSIEIVLHSALASALILTLASLSPRLAHQVSDIVVLQEKAISLLTKWAFPGSSIEGMLQIALAMRDKRKMIL
ncbi:C6 finger domain-containing protein [Ilyonectria robusta]